MNKEDRARLKDIYDKLDEARAMLEELKDGHQERIDNMQDAFPNGSARLEEMEEQQSTLDQIHDDLENVEAEFDEIM